MKTKLLFALAASFFSLTAFSQKKKTQEKTQTRPEEWPFMRRKRQRLLSGAP